MKINNSRISGLLLTILFLLALILPIVPVRAEPEPGTVDLVILPAAQTVTAGSTFTVTVQAQCGTQTVDGLDVYLSYEPGSLAIESATAGLTFPIILMDAAWDNGAGTFSFAAGTLTTPLPSGTFDVIKITFTALNPPAQITFDPSSTSVDMGGTDVKGTLAPADILPAPYPAPAITGISPNSGPVNGGIIVTISGTSLTGATSVSFDSNPAADFTVNSDTQITATSPEGSAGKVNVTVTTDVGTSATSSTNQFNYIVPPSPTVSGISPSSGPTAGGTSVTITGTGFVSGAVVSIGGNPATEVTVDSSTSIKATTPSGTAGAKVVAVTTPSGTGTKTGGFTYLANNSSSGNNNGGVNGTGTSNTTVSVSVFGNSSTFISNSAGVVQQAFTVTSTDGKMGLTIPPNTLAKNAAGTALSSLTEVINSNPPAPPSGNIIGMAVNFGPSGATFSPPITFVYHYTATDFAAGISEANLTMAFYDTQTETWVDLKQKYGADYVKVDPVNDTITALIPHFTTFAVMGKAIAPSPASSPTPTPTLASLPSPSPAAITVSSSTPVAPPPSSSLLPSSVAAPVTTASTLPESTRPANSFNWALVIGIIAAVIVVIVIVFVIMVTRRKGQ